MRITLKHIAEKTGYSISTVSRVLNGTNKISLDVQRRIVQVAEELEYPFNKNQIPMYSNGTKDIVLISELAHGEFYASAYTGYFNAAGKLDVNLSLISANQHEKSLFDIITARIQHQVDGIALFVPTMEYKDYKKLLEDLNKAQISIPIISNGLIENPILPTITFDGYSGGFVAAECFDQRNMKKVGIVKGPSGKAESSFRANGFKDYCMHHNLEVVWEVQGDFTFDSGYKSFEAFQHSIQQPQGIFFSNDLMAAGFSIAATNAGLQIPRDVSIIGYDNLPVCYQLQPNLSSIETDFEELGRLSIQTLLDLIERKGRLRSTLSLVPVSLNRKKSVG